MKLTAYLALWLFIAIVSAYDTYVNVRYPVTTYSELNPIARFILSCSNEDFALLIALKLIGTSISLSLLLVAYFYSKLRAFCIIGVLAIVQLAVLLFLIYA